MNFPLNRFYYSYCNFNMPYFFEIEYKIKDKEIFCKNLSFTDNLISSGTTNFNLCSHSIISSNNIENSQSVDKQLIENRNAVIKRSILDSDERQFILFLNTLLKFKLKEDKAFKLFVKPSYKLFNNKFRNLSKRKELLEKSLYEIFIDKSNYEKESSIFKNQKIIETLVEKDSNLLEYLKSTSIRSYITPDSINEVLNSNEFLKKINRKSLHGNSHNSLISKIKQKVLKYVH